MIIKIALCMSTVALAVLNGCTVLSATATAGSAALSVGGAAVGTVFDATVGTAKILSEGVSTLGSNTTAEAQNVAATAGVPPSATNHPPPAPRAPGRP
jgi:hypothetical protein